jgi:hypothetical protein
VTATAAAAIDRSGSSKWQQHVTWWQRQQQHYVTGFGRRQQQQQKCVTSLGSSSLEPARRPLSAEAAATVALAPARLSRLAPSARRGPACPFTRTAVTRPYKLPPHHG